MATSSNVKHRQTMAHDDRAPGPSSASRPTPRPTPKAAASASSPFLPTPRETLLLGVFPAILVFGTLYSTLSPQTRAAAAAATTAGSPSLTSHYPQAPAMAPSYFARKNNVFNVVFVKRGWFWITATFAAFVATHPFFAAPAVHLRSSQAFLGRRASAATRWALVTAWWFLVTQWFFGPALIDRSFRLTGGGCEALAALADDLEAEHAGSRTAQLLMEASSSSACRHAGGQWRGGHDISGHVFLLTLGTTFLAQEMGWVLWRTVAGSAADGARVRTTDARAIVMGDGAIKSAEAEAGLSSSRATATDVQSTRAAVLVTRAAAAVMGLCLWMLLMTAIFFHTWPEKLTGLVVALAGFYGVYIVPRFVPMVRQVVGLPGL